MKTSIKDSMKATCAVHSERDDGLAKKVGDRLKEQGLTIACAESCTGGLLTARLTDIRGSSAYVLGGVVSYTNSVKMSLLGVREASLKAYGAVSEVVAREMAEGVRQALGADFGIGITGIAGPDGATAEKPVGLVYIALSKAKDTQQATTKNMTTQVTKNLFQGTRLDVRFAATEMALSMLLEHMDEPEKT